MRRSGTLPKNLAGHDSWSHDSQQDAVFHGCPASHVAHLQLHTSQSHWRGASCGELDQCRACLGAPVLAATAESPSHVVGLGHLCLLPGDWDRNSKTPHHFAKGYKGHWSKEIFHVEAVQDTRPHDLGGVRCCWQTYQGDLLRPGTSEGHATRLLWYGSHSGHPLLWEHHAVPD